MKKFKIFMNPIKEEAWINAQLEKGYQLIAHSSWGLTCARLVLMIGISDSLA
ncbi:hypothetical protein [Staphylococcus coagulans]|uniref:hypothetical protein n=1 Tax=Staphylococcus coagulans TaxID=74706 RepID=UPI0015F8D3A4|nr:hypothetical protein [Staphylococcus coagulans]MBA8764361.1 hypothetical protein [Staphylococcus coagulans]MBT2809821.1 hypothetical protein [Staphylococcus coagulans]MBT2811963.1 hypothetical protein [Staphylococcus coagulans]MBT2818927.1 hypothetical protein [Staphylococcus coagulans]MBT2821299.1 hypothetical protein [Staphylococcus coagulans]